MNKCEKYVPSFRTRPEPKTKKEKQWRKTNDHLYDMDTYPLMAPPFHHSERDWETQEQRRLQKVCIKILKDHGIVAHGVWWYGSA